MESPKSLILKLRLKPDAKKPPNGAMMDANMASTTACSCNDRAHMSNLQYSGVNLSISPMTCIALVCSGLQSIALMVR